MDKSREDIIKGVETTVRNLGKKINPVSYEQAAQQAAKQPGPRNAIGVPVAGSGFVRILMFIVAGILLIGIILIGVDQWITPVFQRTPGAPGYIPIPGTDTTEVFWLTADKVGNITIGTEAVTVNTIVQDAAKNLVSQGSYSITLDVLITSEYPENIGTSEQRIFFLIGATVDTPSLRIGMDNSKNKVYITVFDNTTGFQQSVSIDNVPIHTPFRIGYVLTQGSLEGYLNGLLVQTKMFNEFNPTLPSQGNKIFSPNNIVSLDTPPIVLSSGIEVLNVRTFGYAASPSEMRSRMNDLMDKSTFTLVTKKN